MYTSSSPITPLRKTISTSTWCNFQINDNNLNRSVPDNWSKCLVMILFLLLGQLSILNSRFILVYVAICFTLDLLDLSLARSRFTSNLLIQLLPLNSDLIQYNTHHRLWENSSCHTICFIHPLLPCQSPDNLYYIPTIPTRRPWKNNYNQAKDRKASKTTTIMIIKEEKYKVLIFLRLQENVNALLILAYLHSSCNFVILVLIINMMSYLLCMSKGNAVLCLVLGFFP